MSKMIKYVVECNSLYKLIAVIIVCALLGTSLYFMCDTVQHITDKICEYKEVSIKAQYDDTSLEVDLHERDRMGTEQSSSYFIYSLCVSFKLTVHTNPTFIYYLLCYVIGESSNTL